MVQNIGGDNGLKWKEGHLILGDMKERERTELSLWCRMSKIPQSALVSEVVAEDQVEANPTSNILRNISEASRVSNWKSLLHPISNLHHYPLELQ